MSETKAPAEGEGKDAPKKSSPLSLGTILVFLNTLAVLGVLGLVIYTKVIYKRPTITEPVERARVEQTVKKETVEKISAKHIVKFEPINANLKPSPIGPTLPGAPPPELKQHFLNMTIAMELTSVEREADLKVQMPKFLDATLKMLGGTTVDELATVQGRFILRSRLAGIMNVLLRKNKDDAPVVSNVYFLDFMVQ